MTHPRNQDGFAIIEVIVSAAVLAIVALAVLSGIDGATASTARERARAVAGSLAEQDQERMRGYRFDELDQIPQQPVQVIDGVTYSIKSEASWVVDEGAVSATCGATGSKQSEYLRIVTTVTSAMVGARIPAVKIESLVAPPVSGSLVVKLEGGIPARNPANIQVQAISKTDGRTYTEVTNGQGCAIFRTIETGEYTIRLNTPGYVDKKGQTVSETTATVNSALVTVVNMSYDRAVSMKLNVRTLKPGETFPNATSYASKATAVSDTAAEAGTLRTFTPPAAASSIDATKLFPFATAYSYFTGRCAIQSPVKVGLPNYFSDKNKAAAVIADPDATVQPQVATIYQPALNLRVRASSSSVNPSTTTFDATGMRVYVALQPVGTETCTIDFQPAELDIKNWPSTGWGTSPGGLDRNWVVQNSTDFDPGLPFGTYKICLRDGSMWWSTAGTGANPHYDNTKTERATMSIPPALTPTSDWKGTRPAGC